MLCLYNYIGLLGCGTIAPESGLYVNILQGITTESIAAIADGEQENYLGVWEDIQQRAMRKFNTLVLAQLKSRFKIKSILDTVDIGKATVPATTYPAAGKWKGFEVSFKHFTSDSLAQISVQEIVLFLSASSSTTVRIYDVDTGLQLFTYSISNSSGWVKVAVGKSFSARKIFICFDATAVIQTSLPLPAYRAGYGSCYDCSCHGCELIFNGAESDDIAHPVTLTRGSESFGISAVLSLKCSLEQLVCNNKAAFANAWMYLLGSEIMLETLYSDKINRWTTVDRNKAKQLIGEFENTFTGEIATVCETLELHDGCCVECQDLIMNRESCM